MLMGWRGETGQVIVVVGAPDGVGGAVAEQHAAAGDRVMLWGRDGRAVAASARRVRGRAATRAGSRAAAMPVDAFGLDASDPEAVIAAWNALVERCGEPDALVCVVGSSRAGGTVGTRATVSVTRHAARRFRAAGRGAITVVLTGSAAQTDGPGEALVAHLRELTAELADFGITVTTRSVTDQSGYRSPAARRGAAQVS